MQRLTNPTKILRFAKKRKRVILREADYGACEDLVHRGLLNKNFPNHPRAHGWPEYKISKKGLRFLQGCQ